MSTSDGERGCYGASPGDDPHVSRIIRRGLGPWGSVLIVRRPGEDDALEQSDENALLEAHRTDRGIERVGIKHGLEPVEDLVGNVGEVALVLARHEHLLGARIYGHFEAFR